MRLIQEIHDYQPLTRQEESDKLAILYMLKNFSRDILSRENTIAHMTSSGFILNESLTKVLMIHHNIYQSWGWTGGHADGEEDLPCVALREATEETGLHSLYLISKQIASLDILPVLGHERRGLYISAHLHFSVAYLLVGAESEALRHNPDENSGARWIKLKEISTYCKEPHMLPIYAKLIGKARKIHEKQ